MTNLISAEITSFQVINKVKWLNNLKFNHFKYLTIISITVVSNNMGMFMLDAHVLLSFSAYGPT